MPFVFAANPQPVHQRTQPVDSNGSQSVSYGMVDSDATMNVTRECNGKRMPTMAFLKNLIGTPRPYGPRGSDLYAIKCSVKDFNNRFLAIDEEKNKGLQSEIGCLCARCKARDSAFLDFATVVVLYDRTKTVKASLGKLWACCAYGHLAIPWSYHMLLCVPTAPRDIASLLCDPPTVSPMRTACVF